MSNPQLNILTAEAVVQADNEVIKEACLKPIFNVIQTPCRRYVQIRTCLTSVEIKSQSFVKLYDMKSGGLEIIETFYGSRYEISEQLEKTRNVIGTAEKCREKPIRVLRKYHSNDTFPAQNNLYKTGVTQVILDEDPNNQYLKYFAGLGYVPFQQRIDVGVVFGAVEEDQYEYNFHRMPNEIFKDTMIKCFKKYTVTNTEAFVTSSDSIEKLLNNSNEPEAELFSIDGKNITKELPYLEETQENLFHVTVERYFLDKIELNKTGLPYLLGAINLEWKIMDTTV